MTEELAGSEEQVASAGVAPTAPTAARAAAGPPVPSGPAPRRPSRAATKVASLTINYDYLRRDLRTLGLLAPLMVVLVVVSFFIFH